MLRRPQRYILFPNTTLFQSKSSLLRAVGLDGQKKQQIETLLHERGLSDDGKIAYLRSIPPKQQYYRLKYAMSSEQRFDILKFFTQEIRTACEQRRKVLFLDG